MKILGALPVVLFCLNGGGRGASPELKPARLYFVVSQSLIGAFKKDDATPTMRKRSVDLLLLDTPEYLVLAHEGLVEAVAGGTSRGQLAAFPHLLLAKKESGVLQIGALRGKSIGVASRTRSNLGIIWRETLLAKNKLERAVSFFGSVDISNGASSCVLPLFFGKLDGCVVDSGNWETHRTALGDQRSTVFRAGLQVAVTIRDFESEDNLLNRYRGLLKLPVDLSNPVVGRLNEVREIR